MNTLHQLTYELRNTQEEYCYQYLKVLSHQLTGMINSASQEIHNEWKLNNILFHSCTHDDEIGLYISFAFKHIMNKELEPEIIEMISQEDYGTPIKTNHANIVNEKTRKRIQYLYDELFASDKSDIAKFISDQLRTNVICYMKENHGENGYIHFNEKDNIVALKKMLGIFFSRYEKEQLEENLSNNIHLTPKKLKV